MKTEIRAVTMGKQEDFLEAIPSKHTRKSSMGLQAFALILLLFFAAFAPTSAAIAFADSYNNGPAYTSITCSGTFTLTATTTDWYNYYYTVPWSDGWGELVQTCTVTIPFNDLTLSRRIREGLTGEMDNNPLFFTGDWSYAFHFAGDGWDRSMTPSSGQVSGNDTTKIYATAYDNGRVIFAFEPPGAWPWDYATVLNIPVTITDTFQYPYHDPLDSRTYSEFVTSPVNIAFEAMMDVWKEDMITSALFNQTQDMTFSGVSPYTDTVLPPEAPRIQYTGSLELSDFSSTEPNDLSVSNVEPIQVIRNAEALVANKETVLRVDVLSTYSSIQRANVEVTYDFGKTTIDEGPEQGGIPIKPGHNVMYLPGGPVFYPDGTNEPCWKPFYDEPGQVNYLYWDHAGLDRDIKANVQLLPDEASSDNNEKSTSMNVFETESLNILFVPVNFLYDNPSLQFLDSDFPLLLSRIDSWTRCVNATYPTANVSWHLLWPPQQAPIVFPTSAWLYTTVVKRSVRVALVSDYVRVVVLIKDLDRFYENDGTEAEAIGMVNLPETREPIVADPDMEEWVLAHEIGHTFYLWHPGNPGPPVTEAQRFWVAKRDYEKSATTFMATELSGDVWIDKGRYDSDPREPVEIDWPPHYTWNWNLLDQFKKSPKREIILVSGVLYKNKTARFDPSFYRLEGKEPATSSNYGDYSIVLLGHQQQVLSQLYFNASFVWATEKGENFETDEVPFIIDVPYIGGVSEIELKNSTGNVLAHRTVTTIAPTVNVTFPNGGETLQIGTNYTVTWNASDPEGDTLTYTVAYSEDMGQTWVPLVDDLNQTSYVWNTRYLNPGNGYLIMVTATDGVNTGEDTSDDAFIFVASTNETIPTPTLTDYINDFLRQITQPIGNMINDTLGTYIPSSVTSFLFVDQPIIPVIIGIMVLAIITAIAAVAIKRRKRRVQAHSRDQKPPQHLEKPEEQVEPRASGESAGKTEAPQQGTTPQSAGIPSGGPSKRFVFCLNCGERLPSSPLNFCPFCGASLVPSGGSTLKNHSERNKDFKRPEG